MHVLREWVWGKCYEAVRSEGGGGGGCACMWWMLKEGFGTGPCGGWSFTHQPAAGLPAGRVCLTAESGSSPPPS